MFITALVYYCMICDMYLSYYVLSPQSSPFYAQIFLQVWMILMICCLSTMTRWASTLLLGAGKATTTSFTSQTDITFKNVFWAINSQRLCLLKDGVLYIFISSLLYVKYICRYDMSYIMSTFCKTTFSKLLYELYFLKVKKKSLFS